MIMRYVSLLPSLIISACALLGASPASARAGESRFSAEIIRTSFGIPHIVARNEMGLGYGAGYAYAQDNLCLLADTIITVNGLRSKYFGPQNSNSDGVNNFESDVYFRVMDDAGTVNTAWNAQTPAVRSLLIGYAAGYNRFLRDDRTQHSSAACRSAPWVNPISPRDLVKVMRWYTMEGSSGQLVAALATAAPPAKGPAAADHRRSNFSLPSYERLGSDAVAIGSRAAAGAEGLLLADPHLPWAGSLRLYELQATIPGKLDVMGATLGGFPGVLIGFTRNFAWSHTVTTSAHYTIYRLNLRPGHPTWYELDGRFVPMDRKIVQVPVKAADGKVTLRSWPVYLTRYGWVLRIPRKLDWTEAHAFALRDANMENYRIYRQWYAMDRAASLGQFKAAIMRIEGIPWTNTVAVGRGGVALYLDVTVVPFVSSRRESRCIVPAFRPLIGQHIFVLRATADCQWNDSGSASQRGIFPASELPILERRDYVQNSNDSAWLTNPAAPMTGFPDIVSQSGQAGNWRTRFALHSLAALGAGDSGTRVDLTALENLLMKDDVYLAQVLRPSIVQLCGTLHTVTDDHNSLSRLASACKAMLSWDGTANLDAGIGFGYFTAFARRVLQMPGVWVHEPNPADPVAATAALNCSSPAALRELVATLKAAAADVERSGWMADQTWGQVQFDGEGSSAIPIHGGAGPLGIYNAIYSVPDGRGRQRVIAGSSYMQAVAFSAAGVHAQALLTYSESSNPNSDHYRDQTELYSKKRWVTLPFTSAQIHSDPHLSISHISE